MTMKPILSRAALLAALLAGCGRGEASDTSPPATTAMVDAETFTVRDSTIPGTFESAGIAEPIARATLSTRLTGSVTEVLVREGDRVRSGELLARIDARDVEARRAQVEAGIAAAEALYQDARTQADRFRALYADSAATRYQLEQVETGLARAEAGLQTARASRAELDAVGAYAEIRSPFSGIVTRRFVDPGAFAAPGAPIVEVQDASRLRVSVTLPPPIAARLRPGAALDASIEGRPAHAVLEGTVPAPASAVYTLNAIVQNPRGEFLPGSAATIRVPSGSRNAMLIPADALVREGDLTGVRLRTDAGSELRWVKAMDSGSGTGGMIEILSGLRSGDVILIGSR
jgi:RND family efflux transporter MFP subunit